MQKDPCSEFDYSSPRDSCGLLGALPAPEGYVKPASGDRGGDFGARSAGSVIGGVSIVKPKQYGGLTAYNMNSGDKSWWIPNGGMMKVTSRDPIFTGVTLPEQSARGQAEAITTKSLVIYGTGRGGGTPGAPPQIFAVDKATGKQVGSVKLEAKNTAVPMTFMHQGKQYIVYASGSEESTSLTALALPRK